MDYTATKIKTFNGMEGRGYNATICLNGKAVAEVIDDAHGGPIMVHWLDYKGPKVEGEMRQFGEDTLVKRTMTVNEARFHAILNTLPKVEHKSGDFSYWPTVDIAMDEIVNRSITAKRLTAMLKKKIVFIKSKAIYTITLVEPIESDRAQASIKRLKADGVQHIFNEMKFEDALTMAYDMGF